MSPQQLDPDTEYVDVSITKTKVGPLTQRYGNGGFREVDTRQTDDQPTRYALVGLDNSHSSDYKVGYASDPLLVVHAPVGYTHDELREVLKHNELWKEEFEPIDIPHGRDQWKAGFKSLPRSANMLDPLSITMEKQVDRDMDYREGGNSIHGWIPKPE